MPLRPHARAATDLPQAARGGRSRLQPRAARPRAPHGPASHPARARPRPGYARAACAARGWHRRRSCARARETSRAAQASRSGSRQDARSHRGTGRQEGARATVSPRSRPPAGASARPDVERLLRRDTPAPRRATGPPARQRAARSARSAARRLESPGTTRRRPSTADPGPERVWQRAERSPGRDARGRRTRARRSRARPPGSAARACAEVRASGRRCDLGDRGSARIPGRRSPVPATGSVLDRLDSQAQRRRSRARAGFD